MGAHEKVCARDYWPGRDVSTIVERCACSCVQQLKTAAVGGMGGWCKLRFRGFGKKCDTSD
eukprot:3406112-Prymnesium_polylepis.1